MNPLDGILVLLMLLAMVGGYRLGFVARAGSWLGFVCGMVIGARMAPVVVGALDGNGAMVLLIAASVVVIGMALVGQAIGMAIGSSLRRQVRGPGRTLDHIGGGIAGVVGVLVVTWLLLPAIGSVPGQLARMARSSAVISLIDERSPQPPDSLAALRRIVGDAPFPEVFVGMRPAPVTGPPPSALPLSGEVANRVARSTVNVEAADCGRIQEGSGFTVEPGLVATNAHVVAGATEIEVLDPTGARTQAVVVSFDAERDLALLRTPELAQMPLPLSTISVGGEAAVFGHPGGQDQLRIAPAGIQEEITAVGRDIYGDGRINRQVFVLASDLRQGDSGAAVVDPSGSVVGVAFAIAPDSPQTAYALTVAELQAALAAPRTAGGDAGPCIR
jgi:S1-C subfamily serine protease